MRRPASFRLLRRLMADRKGNALMIFGISVVPLMIATGMGIDYSHAARLQTKLNATADAAALAAVTQPMMEKSDEEARQAAINMFSSQAANLPGLIFDPADLTVTVLHPGGVITDRTVTVAYQALSINSFGGVLGKSTIAIGGNSQANAKVAPNIDFYIMLDTSNSMALPTTSDGLATLKSRTGGCAFACHSTNGETAKDKNGKTTDYYGVARSYGLSLRVDEEALATKNLMTVAKSTSSINKATYRMSISTFAEGASSAFPAGTFTNIQPITTNLDAAAAKAETVQVSLYYKNNCPTASRCNNDTDTGTSDAFTKMNKLIPNPGNGTNTPGDSPQAMVFIITDGMRDEARPGGKPEVEIDTSKCTTIKNRGIRIAVLYTEYLPESISGDSWSTSSSQGDVYNRLYKIEPALQNCASSGLYYKVTTNDDISAALNSLFAKAVATAHIIQ